MLAQLALDQDPHGGLRISRSKLLASIISRYLSCESLPNKSSIFPWMSTLEKIAVRPCTIYLYQRVLALFLTYVHLLRLDWKHPSELDTILVTYLNSMCCEGKAQRMAPS